MSTHPAKEALRDALAASLRAELEATEAAWRSAVAGATHEESRPENDKDTRALEQSYLARGQAARVAELRGSLEAVLAMRVDDRRGEPAGVGACVALEDEHGAVTRVLLVERGGGASLPGGVRAVSVTSPLGGALVGRVEGDDVEVPRGSVLVGYTVREVW